MIVVTVVDTSSSRSGKQTLTFYSLYTHFFLVGVVLLNVKLQAAVISISSIKLAISSHVAISQQQLTEIRLYNTPQLIISTKSCGDFVLPIVVIDIL